MSKVTVWMAWEPRLATPYATGENGRPTVRREVREWQEELAAELCAGLQSWSLVGSLFVVDIEFFFPEDGQYDPETFTSAILQAVEMGSGWSREQLIPLCRTRPCSGPPMEQDDVPGFRVTLFPIMIGGHGLTGEFEFLDTQAIICLDRRVPFGWRGMRVRINVGVICDATQ